MHFGASCCRLVPHVADWCNLMQIADRAVLTLTILKLLHGKLNQSMKCQARGLKQIILIYRLSATLSLSYNTYDTCFQVPVESTRVAMLI